MPRYVAFLRAINVGGHTVKMDQLRELFIALKLANVETFIASGNVVFETKANVMTLERKIEKHLQSALGYEVTTFMRSIDELVAISKFKPFSDQELTAKGNQLYVGFLGKEPAPSSVKGLMALRSEIDDFRVEGREAYWLVRRSLTDRKFQGPPFEKLLGMQTTLRNVNTVNRLVAKYS